MDMTSIQTDSLKMVFYSETMEVSSGRIQSDLANLDPVLIIFATFTQKERSRAKTVTKHADPVMHTVQKLCVHSQVTWLQTTLLFGQMIQIYI